MSKDNITDIAVIGGGASGLKPTITDYAKKKRPDPIWVRSSCLLVIDNSVLDELQVHVIV